MLRNLAKAGIKSVKSNSIKSPDLNSLPQNLTSAIRDVYETAGMKVTQAAVCENESAEYGACRLSLNDHSIMFRIAKTTPTKIGQFVTMWKRSTLNGEISPLDITDGVDFVVIHASDKTHHGQFVFNQKILLQKDIISNNNAGGKRGIRVYPPWTKPTAKEAIKTQQWQLPYFLSFKSDGTADPAQVCKLFDVTQKIKEYHSETLELKRRSEQLEESLSIQEKKSSQEDSEESTSKASKKQKLEILPNESTKKETKKKAEYYTMHGLLRGPNSNSRDSSSKKTEHQEENNNNFLTQK